MKRVFVVLAALSTLAGCGEGEDTQEQGDLGAVTAKVTPLYAEIGCYIDTPALDEFNIGGCMAYGTSPSVAVFKMFTSTPAAQIVWYGHPECTGAQCVVPISPGQRITMDGYYITLESYGIGAAAATARYIR